VEPALAGIPPASAIQCLLFLLAPALGSLPCRTARRLLGALLGRLPGRLTRRLARRLARRRSLGGLPGRLLGGLPGRSLLLRRFASRSLLLGRRCDPGGGTGRSTDRSGGRSGGRGRRRWFVRERHRIHPARAGPAQFHTMHRGHTGVLRTRMRREPAAGDEARARLPEVLHISCTARVLLQASFSGHAAAIFRAHIHTDGTPPCQLPCGPRSSPCWRRLRRHQPG
jgi:hypothetical protein